jgi:hypothetical protein
MRNSRLRPVRRAGDDRTVARITIRSTGGPPGRAAGAGPPYIIGSTLPRDVRP